MDDFLDSLIRVSYACILTSVAILGVVSFIEGHFWVAVSLGLLYAVSLLYLVIVKQLSDLEDI